LGLILTYAIALVCGKRKRFRFPVALHIFNVGIQCSH